MTPPAVLDVAHSDRRAAGRHARESLAVLLDIDDGGARRRSLDSILGVSRACESDGTEVGERNEGSILLKVLSLKSALERLQSDG